MTAVAAWVAAKVTAVVAGTTGSLAAAQTVYAVAYYGTQLAFYAGLSALGSALQGTPDSDAVQGSKKQPVP